MRRIAGIHNYCTRWCERCPLGHRCAINDKHAGDEEWLKNLERKIEKASEQGDVFEEIDWDKVDEIVEEESTEELSEEEAITGFDATTHPLYTQGMTLSKGIQKLLDQLGPLIEEEEKQDADGLSLLLDNRVLILDNCEQVLGWYLYFIQTKLYRALSGKYDSMEDFDPVQNDWNGSAKVVKIAADHCHGAVRQVLAIAKNLEDECLSLLQVLQRFQSSLETEFPQTDAFIRPGFDQLGVEENYGV